MPGPEPADVRSDAVFSVDFRVKLTAVVTPEPVGGFSAVVPDLPGCVTEAESPEELRTNLRDAAEGWIAAHAGQLREWMAENAATGS